MRLPVVTRVLSSLFVAACGGGQVAPPGGGGCTGRDSPSFAIHSFIFANYPDQTRAYLFDAAKRTGKTVIRFDFSLGSVEPTEGKFEWQQMDSQFAMAQARGLEVIGTLGYSAPWISDPQSVSPWQGPIDRTKLAAYEEYVRQTVTRYREVRYWEVWNEPNTQSLYASQAYGVQDFAEILARTHDVIKSVDATDQVVFPGVIIDNDALQTWTEALLNAASGKFDIANFHIRGSIATITSKMNAAKTMFRSARPGVPLWVTEHGYSADPAFQQDPQYRGTDVATGERMQADYYRESLPLLASLGAAKVFVTLRDYGDWERFCQAPNNRFCWEGLVTLRQAAPNYDRPAMCVFQEMQ